MKESKLQKLKDHNGCSYALIPKNFINILGLSSNETVLMELDYLNKNITIKIKPGDKNGSD